MDNALNLNSLRASKARLAHKIGKLGYDLSVTLAIVLTLVGLIIIVTSSNRLAFLLLALALASFVMALWYRRDLSVLPPTGNTLDGRLDGSILAKLNVGQDITPQSVWRATEDHWQTRFILNHLLLPPDDIASSLSVRQEDTAALWKKAADLADSLGSKSIEPGYVTGALLLSSKALEASLTSLKLSSNDVVELLHWLSRALDLIHSEKPYFGGIGRDWAHGFTPKLNQFGTNISLSIEAAGGSHYAWLTSSPGVEAIKNAFGQGAAAVGLIGPPGIGKTSHVYALAQLLLAQKDNPKLEHRQIIGLNASAIISAAQQPGQLEYIVTSLMNEAVHAGHVVLFLDDAQLFFESGPGSFDITQILLPVIQSGRVQLIMAMTPADFQKLKAERATLAELLMPVVLKEPEETDVMKILEDTALGLEGKNKMVISYQAVQAAYKLSGRYEQDMAYPGKAIRLLQEAVPYNDQGFLTAESIQKTIEQTRGVKAGSAQPIEADALLHLEDKIHQRMINQARAVSVVASALRRNRAGVGDTRRPIGSFLFLGPTGVGKTELARSLAATYFNSEANMVRLDMSEYQQAEDVKRLLSDGRGESKSLILAVREQPFSVLLLDEIEKAHPNVLNLLLQLLDEGQLTDSSGRPASFKDCIIIATSNAGANTIRERIAKGESLESFEAAFTDELISSNQFKPELLNRFDEIVLFRPLTAEELVQIVGLMMNEVNKTLADQKISVQLTAAAAQKIVESGNDPRLGARPMRRVLQHAVQDQIANKILSGEVKPGAKITLDTKDLQLQ